MLVGVTLTHEEEDVELTPATQSEIDTPFVNADDMFSIFDKIPVEELNIVFASFLKKAENPHHFSFIMRYKDKIVDYHDNLVHIVRSNL